MSPKISKELSKHRLEQAYDEFVVRPEVTQEQIDTAQEFIKLVEEYMQNNQKMC